MRSFAADFAAEKNKSFARPFLSAVFRFGGSIGDIYLADYDVVIGGNAHKGCVKSWGEYGSLARLIDGAFAARGMRVTIVNHPLFGTPAQRFTDLWTSVGVEGVEVDVYHNFLKSDDPGIVLQTLVFVGVMRPGPYTPDLCEVELAPIAEKYLSQEISFPVDQSDFPSADPADIGERAHVIYGAVKRVRAHAVAVGLKSTIRATMGTGDTTVPIHDDFHDALPASGTIQIGNEKIAYSGKGGAAGARTLTGLTRGSGSTPVESHNKGDTIVQIVSSWIFLAAGHAMKSIDRVYVRRGDKLIPLASSQYTVNLANTTLVSGKTLTTIAFTAPPLVAEKDYVSLTASEATKEDVGSDQAIVLTPPTPWPDGASVNQNISAPAQTGIKSSGNFIKRLSVARASGGQNGQYNVYLVNQSSGLFDHMVINGLATVAQNPITKVETNFWNLALYYRNDSGNTLANPSPITVNVWSKSVTYNVLGAALNSTSTADNPVGDVYFDGQGYADDGSGTYTGTANALIEKPADVLHHLVRVVAAIPAGRVDAAAFQQARGDAPASHKLSAVLTERASNLKTLLLAVGMQSRLKIDWPADKLTVRFLKSSYGAAGKTIGRDQIRAQREGLKTSLRLSRTPIEELINKIDLYYGRDWSRSRGRDAFNKISKASDAASIAKYGKREDEDRFWYDFIAADNSAMADDLRDFWLARLKEPARIVECDVFLDQLELLPGDVVAFDYRVAGNAFDGLAGGNKFLLEEISVAPRSIKLKLREVV